MPSPFPAVTVHLLFDDGRRQWQILNLKMIVVRLDATMSIFTRITDEHTDLCCAPARRSRQHSRGAIAAFCGLTDAHQLRFDALVSSAVGHFVRADELRHIAADLVFEHGDEAGNYARRVIADYNPVARMNAPNSGWCSAFCSTISRPIASIPKPPSQFTERTRIRPLARRPRMQTHVR